MDIHNLTKREKRIQRKQHMCLDFPYAYAISLGEWKCNRLCRMCPMYGQQPAHSRYISNEVFERACKEVADREISLEISAFGETFMHTSADDYMFTSRRLCPNATIVIATNGALLDEERCEKIVDSGIDHLSFSLDAGSAESYEWLTGAKDYDNVCKNLERLVETREKRNAKHLKITTHIIGIKELSHEFDLFVQRWGKIVDSAVVRNYGNWAGLVDDNGVSSAEDQNVPVERYPCAWLWYATKIEPNGDVSKCFIHITGEKNPLGNIMQQSFKSIWKGEKLNRLRELHCENQYNGIEFCGNCMVWSLFPKFWKPKKQFWIFNSKRWQ